MQTARHSKSVRVGVDRYHHHHHHQSLNLEGRWGTTDDFATSFLRFSLFSTALRDLPNSRPVLSLMLSSHLFLWQRKRWECVMGSLILRLLSATVTLSLRSQSPTCEKWGRKGEGVRYASFWGKWGLPSDITHLIQKSCYQRGRLCQDPTGDAPHEIFLTIVKRRKLKRYCHVSHSSGLGKTIMQGAVKGGRRQGRQTKRWEDNFREWTGLEFAESKRAVESREKWRKLVVKSSVVPQRPSRLRNRWWWWLSSLFLHIPVLCVKTHGSQSAVYMCL